MTTTVDIEALKAKIDFEAGRVMRLAADWRAQGRLHPRQRRSINRSADTMMDTIARSLKIMEKSSDPYLLAIALDDLMAHRV